MTSITSFSFHGIDLELQLSFCLLATFKWEKKGRRSMGGQGVFRGRISGGRGSQNEIER
jgi:hypothetical protein